MNNRSAHSVGVGADSSRPSAPNCINAITHHSGCTWVNVGAREQSAAYIP